MIKDFFLFFILGLIFLVLQSTWLAGEAINPFRPDLIFILIIFVGTLNQLGLGLILSVLLGMLVDILSWGMVGIAVILYPLIFWVFFFVWTHAIQSLAFSVISVLVLQILYGFLVYFFLTLSKGLEFTPHQSYLIVVQAIFTMLVSLPVFYFLKIFFGKKPSLLN